jgi:dTDP-4-amino-4,6-dideoxygalactose transaminase
VKIPLVDLPAQYLALREEIDAAIRRVIRDASFIGGRDVTDFEEKFAAAQGLRNFVSCANGTDAIYIALRALGIAGGDEVITTAHSWISTSEAVTQTGARPVFVDVDDFYTIDIDAIEARISPRTRAIFPVHLYGQPAEMDRIVQLCERHKLLLIEDCAQAHGAAYRGRMVGSFGDAATFSFYPGKNLGAYGDAGGMAFRDPAVAKRARMYANHGALVKHQHLIEGVNSRLDGLQAAILNVKLPHLAEWTRQRRQVAAWYDELLASIPGVERPLARPQGTHVYHLYVIRTGHRPALQEWLAKAGIQTGIHYPTALPMLPAYQYLGATPEAFPRAVGNQGRILSLPIFPELTRGTVEYIAGQIASFQTEGLARATRTSA